MKRLDIAVIELCDEDGGVTPLYVVKDGKNYAVDKVLHVARHAPQVACVSLRLCDRGQKENHIPRRAAACEVVFGSGKLK